ncbi:oxidoreductase FAD/NAD(P)-binding domain protein [Fervidicoccus fontis Kam940]|uniref:Oxidoreductase FAD/NAD(P)-binding domain protein n=2 Tax=Fervidicoccus fontis TaxID=683846 RepID=H9ZZW4_FERFK|nr:oxidoreductase FAD/NAD(P)-binding domain protein [Fervidicoccus fontis Kam940]
MQNLRGIGKMEKKKFEIKPVKIERNEEVAENTFLISFLPLEDLSLEVKPFNFFMVWIPRIDFIPLSVSDYDGNSLTFLYKIKGNGTKALSLKKKNEILGIMGPLGKEFFFKNGEKILVVAGGIGIAPIPYFVKFSKGSEIDLVWGVKKGSELFEVTKIYGKMNNLKNFIIYTEDCSYGKCGKALDALREIRLNEYNRILSVGPEVMMKNFCNLCNKKNDCYVALENLTKCGMGICGSCYIKGTTKLMCSDGPVFECSEVKYHFESIIA